MPNTLVEREISSLIAYAARHGLDLNRNNFRVYDEDGDILIDGRDAAEWIDAMTEE